MTRRPDFIGLSLLCALLVCAFAAQSASAATSKANATAFTCAASTGTGDFKDAHCDEGGLTGQNFAHVGFSGTTKLKATNEKVTTNTTASEPAVLKSTIGGTAVTTTCTKVKNDPTLSTAVNTTEGETHRFTGFARTEYTTCTVTGITPCTIKEPVVFTANYSAEKGHTGPKGEASAMGLTFKGSGAEEVFSEIIYEGASCPIRGTKLPTRGSMIATSGPTTESKQDNAWSGATLVFTPKFEMEKLKSGVIPLELSTILTPTGENGNPITTTTCTKVPPSC